MGRYSTAKAASANRIKIKAVRGMWKLFICSPLLWQFHLRQMPLGDEKAHGAGGKYHIDVYKRQMYTSYSTLQRKQLSKQVYTDTQSTYLLVYAPGRHKALQDVYKRQAHGRASR